MIRPIIVIGMNRSGTKWLSNILCNHSDVIGVQYNRKKSGGIQETNMFGTMQKIFGDLSKPDNYIGLVELWSETDFFRITAAEKELFLTLKPRPTSYLQLFEILMDDYAKRNGKKYWLQKTSPYSANDVLNHYNNAKGIVIRRDIVNNIKSKIHLEITKGQKTSKAVIKNTFFYVLESKLLDRTINEYNLPIVHFERLKADPQSTVRLICRKLKIDYNVNMIKVPFEINQTISSPEERKSFLGAGDLLKIYFFKFFFILIPLHVMQNVKKILGKKNRKHDFIAGTFGMIKDKYDIS